MHFQRNLFLLITFCIFILLFLWYRNFYRNCYETLTRADLPKGAIFVPHMHPDEGQELDANGQPKRDMEHYATEEAIKNGGPIYGVYGYRIVAIEYEIPESRIGVRPVGKDFPGWDISASFLGFRTPVPYEHVHIGIKQKEDEDGENKHEKTYLIHYMLLSHDEELKIGLNCG